jgi:Spy/CpxP family protein refolding chaperone
MPMKKLLLTIVPTALFVAWAYVASAQPPDRPDRDEPPGDQQGGQRGGPQGNSSRRGGPPGWKLGTVIPPPIQNQLNLSDDQRQQLHDLEKEVKQRVMRILNDQQKRKLQTLQRRGPGGPGGPPPGDNGADRGGRGDGPPGDGPPDRRDPPDGQDRRDPPENGTTAELKTSTADHAIQWFASLDSGLKEAQRSGKPIVLVSAAPHCAGIPGVW